MQSRPLYQQKNGELTSNVDQFGPISARTKSVKHFRGSIFGNLKIVQKVSSIAKTPKEYLTCMITSPLFFLIMCKYIDNSAPNFKLFSS